MMENSDINSKKEHDLNAHLSTLQLALDMIRDDWNKNPESVSKVIDLSIAKLTEMSSLLKN